MHRIAFRLVVELQKIVHKCSPCIQNRTVYTLLKDNFDVGSDLFFKKCRTSKRVHLPKI